MARLESTQSVTFKKWVKSAFARKHDNREALPTTRELAQQFDLSASTVFRALVSLEKEKILWQSSQGRFYPYGVRPVMEQPRPFGCLIRKMEHWSLVYQAIMEGVSAACTARGIPLMLWSDDMLVRHENTAQPPVFASDKEQIRFLQKFFDRGRNSFSGMLLDHLWSDKALQQFQSEVVSSILLYRATRLPWLTTMALDFKQAAEMALAHLQERGFERIIPIHPFTGDRGINQMLDAIQRVAKKSELEHQVLAPVFAATPAERKNFVSRLRSRKQRIAILSPEDHIAVLLHEDLQRANLPVPQEIGLLSMQGTKALLSYNISAVAFDFRAMGDCAVRFSLGEIKPPFISLPSLIQRTTT